MTKFALIVIIILKFCYILFLRQKNANKEWEEKSHYFKIGD